MLQVKSRRLKQLHWDKIKTPQQGTVWAKDQPQVNLNLTELENLFQVISPAESAALCYGASFLKPKSFQV